MDAPQIIAIHVVAHANHAGGVLDYAPVRSVVAEWMTRGQAKTGERHNHRVNQHILAIGKGFLATLKAEYIAAAHSSWPECVYPARNTTHAVTARYPLIPAQAEETFKQN